jgi:hypothetical protein
MAPPMKPHRSECMFNVLERLNLYRYMGRDFRLTELIAG